MSELLLQLQRRHWGGRSYSALRNILLAMVLHCTLLYAIAIETTTTTTNVDSPEMYYSDKDNKHLKHLLSRDSSDQQKASFNAILRHLKQQYREEKTRREQNVLKNEQNLVDQSTIRKGTRRRNLRRPMNRQYGRRHEGKTYGEENNSRIIDGTVIKEDQYPWLASLSEKTFLSNGATYGPELENAEIKYIPSCGGALIAPNLVLTAAHCVIKTHRVRLGVHSQSKADDGDDPDVETFNVKDTITHENFDPWFLRYDFAILVLDGNSNKQPVKWNLNPDLTYDEFYVMGWGVTEPGTMVGSDLPHETTVEYVPSQICRSNYGTLVHPEMLCAAKANTDACQGDSGGPLVVKTPSCGNNGEPELTPILVGVVSWGYGCAQPDYPGVYARLTSVISWIHASVCESSSDGCPSWYPDWYINEEDPPSADETKCS